MYLVANLRCTVCKWEWQSWGNDFVLQDLCPNCGCSSHSFVHMWRYDEEGGPLIEESAFDGDGRMLWTTPKIEDEKLKRKIENEKRIKERIEKIVKDMYS
ncbi:MAG: hypothetical protein LBJ89_03505 [Holosporales bacterium]|jgi:hypothetical protein|nr:hypothetical protein [Holosporales bacterium]